MKRLLIGAVLALSLAVLPGCKSGEEAGAQILVQAATMKYIEKAPAGDVRAERAARVKRVASQIYDAAGGLEVTVAALQALAVSQIPGDLEPSDKAIALAIIQLAVTELNGRIGAGQLNPETLIKVRKVVGWIVGATEFYST